MKKIEIEWKHLDKDGSTCIRCADTGKELEKVIGELKRECRGRGMDIFFKETGLSEKEIDESNAVLINGEKIEHILPQASASSNCCGSCCEFTGRKTYCRTIELNGETYEAIPGSLIREAVCRVGQCC